MIESIETADVLDCKGVKDDSVDLIITSPPYNLGIDYTDCKDNMPYHDYLVWIDKVCEMFFRILKDDGRFCVVVPQKTTKNGISRPLASDWTQALLKAGLEFYAEIVWIKGNIHKSCWGSFGSASSPFIRDNTEAIIVGYKNGWKKDRKGKDDIGKDEFVKFSQNDWYIPAVKRKDTEHPAAFPPDLAMRCIKLFSFRGDVVYDPFVGSGTVALEAERLGRRWIGTDNSQDYISKSRKKMKTLLGDIWYTFDLD